MAMGIVPARFWRMTPREFWFRYEAKQVRWTQRMRANAWLVWIHCSADPKTGVRATLDEITAAMPEFLPQWYLNGE